jgi:hypothetical protein
MADKLVLEIYLFDYIYFVYQGILNDTLLIVAYIWIYRRFRDYHNSMIDRFSSIYTLNEIAKLKQSTYEVKIFFVYICIMLCCQTLFLANRCMVNYLRNNPEQYTIRIDDIMRLLLQASHILMNVGLSLSI